MFNYEYTKNHKKIEKSQKSMIYFLLSNSDLVNHKNLINQPMRQNNQEQRLY